MKLKYILHKYREQLISADITVIIIGILLLGVFRPDYVVMFLYLAVMIYLLLTKRKNLVEHLLLATGLAFIWMTIAKNQYGYNQQFLTFAGYSVFPLFAWSLGLFGAYLLYSHFEHILAKKNVYLSMLWFTLGYAFALILLESLSYHVFDIQNVATGMYAGIPIGNCLHAPTWMKISYFSLGPVFISMCYILGLENPHVKIKNK